MNKGSHLYEIFFIAGLFGAVYLYGFHFDSFSETELVNISYLWVAALTFGGHGIIASEVKALIDAGKAETHQEALDERRKMDGRSFLSRIAGLFFFTYLLATGIVNTRRPFLLALAGMGICIFALGIFLIGIFPSM